MLGNAMVYTLKNNHSVISDTLKKENEQREKKGGLPCLFIADLNMYLKSGRYMPHTKMN